MLNAQYGGDDDKDSEGGDVEKGNGNNNDVRKDPDWKPGDEHLAADDEKFAKLAGQDPKFDLERDAPDLVKKFGRRDRLTEKKMALLVA